MQPSPSAIGKNGHKRALPDISSEKGAISTLSQSNPEKRLNSWKEIAAFFERDERTVRRWEIERGLPVHRVPGGARGAVFAFADELEDWLRRPQGQAEQPQIAKTAEKTFEKTLLEKTIEQTGGETGTGRTMPSVIPISAPVSTAESARQNGKSWRRPEALRLLPWIVVGALAAGVFVGVYSYRQTTRFRAHASDKQVGTRRPFLARDTIAVLPFANLRGDAKTDYLSDGITESLIGNLAHIPQLRVRSRDSVFRYKGKDLDMPTIGSNLGVSVLVSGRVMVRGDSIEVSTELTDVQNNTEIWGNRYSGKSADIILLQERMAGDIADKLRSKLTISEEQQVTRQGTQNPEAYDLYLRGRYAWNKRSRTDLEAAISYFNQAIAEDPNYALAYSGLADAYSVMPNYCCSPREFFPKSNAAARKALELDSTLAHPHAVLGVNETQYDWDFAGGRAEFKKALELDPNDASAHQWYAESLDRIGGRQEEAFAEINRARQLDPQSPVIVRELGGILVTAGQYDEAIAVCQKLANDEPTFAIAHDCLAKAYWAKRMYPQVVEEFKTQARLSGVPEQVAFADALNQGFRSEGWNGALTKAIEFREAERIRTGYFSGEEIAQLYTDLGDKDQAFHWLNIAYQEHDWMLIGLKTFIPLAPLRSDPRFDELARKIGLPQ